MLRTQITQLLVTATGVCALVSLYLPGGRPLFIAGSAVLTMLIGWLWLRDRLDWRLILGGAVLFRLVVFPLSPLLSDDAYRYVWDGILQVEGLNPFLYLPAAVKGVVPESPVLFEALNSEHRYTIYPPVSQLVFAVGGWFHGAGWEMSYYVSKGIFALAELGGLGFLARMVSTRNWMLYAWNPLVVVEGVGQMHTEILMVALLIASIWLLREGYSRSAVLVVTLAGWVKLYPLVFLPFLFRRVGWRHSWVAVLGTVGVWLPYADPGVSGRLADSLQLYFQSFEFNAGPYYAVKGAFYGLTGADWSKQVGPAFGILFGMSVAGVYVWDWRDRWSWPGLMLLVIGLLLFWSTTVHPWYLLGVLALIPFARGLSVHWIWLAVGSLGTYMFYVGGWYWPFVWAGWGGWAVLGLYRHGPSVLSQIMRWRARGKWQLMTSHIPETAKRLLDLGAGEGYVGERAAEQRGMEVILADVGNYNATDLPYYVYDGRRLPLADDAVDVTVLCYVLHHAENPVEVVREAVRVSTERVGVLESVYQSPPGRWYLQWADCCANRLRSLRGPAPMSAHHRSVEEWLELFERAGIRVRAHHPAGHILHRKAVFVLENERSRR